MIEINEKMIDFIDADWKICIILDACRYDVFKEVYKKHIKKKGILKKAKTFSNGTKEWIDQNIKEKDCSDIIYVDPIIIMFDKWLPNHSFFKIDEVWKYGWNYDYGTILPKQITKSALKQMKNNPDKRILIHYHQPHPPYLLPQFLNICEPDTPEKIKKSINKKRRLNISQMIQGNMRRFLGSRLAWFLLILFGIEPKDYAGKVYKVSGWDGLVDAYKQTLIMVLKDINKIIDAKNGKLVITSDHSKNYDGSLKNLKSQSVPWLEIK